MPKFTYGGVCCLNHSPFGFGAHPFEIFFNSLLSTTILYFLVGVGPQACAYAVLVTGLAELFYHWNVRTPYWLGFVIQRPESHCVHHQRGLHSFNFADLPLWDMLFGTFRNPRDWHESCGFEDEAERQLGLMLVGKELA